MLRLGVNIDHIATLREVRKTIEPDPVQAALLVELAGADGITVHLREDRRHIQDRDVRLLRETIKTMLNLECGADLEMIKYILQFSPDQVTIVPEKREEITTEGGLDVVRKKDYIKQMVDILKVNDIKVSLFIEPDEQQIEASLEVLADAVEFHTGKYANSIKEDKLKELKRIEYSSKIAYNSGLKVHAGHGLDYINVFDIAKIDYIEELNIGHSIISRSIYVGLKEAVTEMKNILYRARGEIEK